MNAPMTKYAKSGGVSIAYQVVGEGPPDLVFASGFATHVELAWELPHLARFFERLASFSRLIVFDKRGTGLSDPVQDAPTLETRIDDVRAVVDAVGSERTTLWGHSEGGPMCVLFAATYPDRTASLVLSGAMARTTEADDYHFAPPADAFREAAAELISGGRAGSSPAGGAHAERARAWLAAPPEPRPCAVPPRAHGCRPRS